MAAREAGQPTIPVDQAVFSDGLAAISVFVEPVENNTAQGGAGSSGATHVLVKRRGDFWITLLGEVPQATLQQFCLCHRIQGSEVILRLLNPSASYDTDDFLGAQIPRGRGGGGVFAVRTAHGVGASAANLPDFTDARRQGRSGGRQHSHDHARRRAAARAAPLPPGMDDGDMSEFFRRFFGIPMPQSPQSPRRAARRR